MRALRYLAPLALPLAATVACGSIDDANRRQPLAVLQGQLTQPSAAAATPQQASNVRIAVVWVAIDESGYKSTQDIPAEAVFPSKFRLELTEPPPASAMFSRSSAGAGGGGGGAEPPSAGPTPTPSPTGGSGGGTPPSLSDGGAGSRGGTPGSGGGAPAKRAGVRPMNHDTTKDWPADFAVAVGAVVAYEDLNGNGKLDLVDDTATSYVDRVLGANEKLLLVYTEGATYPSALVAPDGTTPKPGYNLMSIGDECGEAAEATDRANTDPGGTSGSATGGSSGSAGGGGASSTTCTGKKPGWLPMTTLYDLPLTAEPRFGSIMCKSQSFFGPTESISSSSVYYPGAPASTQPPPGGYPASNDPKVQCQGKGDYFSYTTCTTTSQGLCKGTITSCNAEFYRLPDGVTTPPPQWPCAVK